MATVTLTALYANLDNWPGRLFQVEATGAITSQTATNFTFRYPSSGVDFPNYQIVITGTGFTYDGIEPLSGDVGQVQIKNGSGQVVLTIANIGPSSLANDFSVLYTDIFGAPGYQDGQGPWPSGSSAWSHLLSGSDIINGTAGDDWQGIVGSDAGSDTYNMGAGDDYVNVGLGNDTAHGGDGRDTLSYSATTYDIGLSAIRGATINVNTGVALDPWGFTDHFDGFEQFQGSAFNDKFTGSLTERDRFSGGRGADTIIGGAISFNGAVQTADSKDEVRYNNDYWDGGKHGIKVNLETSFVNGSIKGTIIDAFGNRDTVVDIERVVGTRFNDVFVGSHVQNNFAGGEGVDSYDGGAGQDTIDFGWYFKDNAPVGLRVNLGLATNQIINDGFGNTETAINIEQAYGSDNADWLRGNAVNNYFEGNGGADTLAGGAGADEFAWWSPDHFGQGDVITDFVAAGAVHDFLDFDHNGFAGMTTTAVVVNGTAAKAAVGTFVYNVANHTLYWDDDGTGAHAKVAITVLNGVTALTTGDFIIW